MSSLKNKSQYFYILVTFLITVGSSYTIYQHWHLGLPWQENKNESIWSVEAMVKFNAKEGSPIKVILEIPNLDGTDGTDFEILHENFISRHYGHSIQPKDNKRYAIWSIRRAKGVQTLYYRLNLYRRSIAEMKEQAKQHPQVQYELLNDIPETEQLTLDSLLDYIRSHSSDIATFTAKAIKTLREHDNPQVNALFNEQKPTDESIAAYVVKLLAMANIPAVPVHAIELREGANVQPSLWVKSYNGEGWLYFNAATGVEGLPRNMLPWASAEKIVNIDGGSKQKLSFSVSNENISSVDLAVNIGEKLHSKAISFSLFSLPLHIQHVYHVLFLVPIGVFVILLLRIFIGLETIGTFMPVLIALAFRDTQLISGIILFIFITALGLLLRANLEQIKLLIVPKLGVILSAVILIMSIISIVSHKLDIESGLSVALFPMVILTMAIERISILWEERGAANAIKTALSSLFAASAAYLVMTIPSLQYLLFAFPGLLLILIAIMLLCGRYRGYRLFELLRFRDLL